MQTQPQASLPKVGDFPPLHKDSECSAFSCSRKTAPSHLEHSSDQRDGDMLTLPISEADQTSQTSTEDPESFASIEEKDLKIAHKSNEHELAPMKNIRHLIRTATLR